MKKKIILGLSLVCLFSNLFSQEKKFGFEFYGWVSPQYFINSHEIVEARDGQLSLYPKPAVYDENGKDKNQNTNQNFSAAASRFGARIFLNDILGAKVVGNLETDFTGQSDANMHLLRLRQANVKMSWEKVSLTMGHGWSAFCVPEMMPAMQDLNNGAPFHPFSRLNHIRVDYSPLKILNVVATAGWQRDYASIGIGGGRDYRQQSFASIPELNLQLQVKTNHLFAGVGAEYKELKPNKDINNTLSSFAYTAFLNYKNQDFNLKLQAISGGNLNDYCMIGGFYEFDGNYTPTTVNSLWCDLSYSLGRITPALFIAGATHDFDRKQENLFGSGMGVENLYRIAPRVDFFLNKDLFFTLTLEYTNVKYQDEICKERIGNYRLGVSLLYRFSSK
ncbi:MAG: hypothetical protein UHM08_07465 [Bacteroidales bacterium]|nr:hypothetical protein [Bacteroidales bacterium]